jgi:carbamoyl-phosphate synthase large subunit
MTLNVLVSSAGRRVALLRILKDELRRLDLHGRVLAADASPLSAAFHDAEARFLVPPCAEPAFVTSVLRLCQDHGIGLVVPTIDPELPIYAEHRPQFEAIGVTVAVSAPETVAISYDKLRTHEWLVAQGFPTVRQAGAADVLATPRDWPWPLIAKPRRGSSSIGVSRVHDVDELRAVTRERRPYVVQALAPGDEYTVDVLVQRDGRCVCAVPRRRLEVRAGEVSKGVTVRNATIERLATDVAERLPGAYGVLNIQLFHDPSTGDVRVIEINPRFGGGYPLTHRAGAPLARWLLEEVAGAPSSVTSEAWRAGMVMLRFDDAVFVDAGQAGVAV